VRLVLLAAVPLFLADPSCTPYRLTGQGFVTNASHPRHPGDVLRVEAELAITLDAPRGEAVIELASGDSTARKVERWFVRRGRIFQVDEKGVEIPAGPARDLSAATVAALHPALVASAMRERPENVHPTGGRRRLFAWNDELWTVDLDGAGRIARLERETSSDLLGDGTEELRYEAWQSAASEDDETASFAQATGTALLRPGRVVVTARGRELARFTFSDSVGVTDSVRVPAGEPRRDRGHVIAYDEIEFREIAPRLFAADLVSLNTRVVVAEFADHVAVLEGAYNSRICDPIVGRVAEQFGKPVRWFAFSHLHGQYIGGTRSWVYAGATVLVPPTTAPLVEEIVRARHERSPDLLAISPRPLRLETVKTRRRLEDSTNVLEIHNVESGHTDEYFLFWFPRQKVLMTGDLLFYRPGKPLAGRSKLLCETVKKLGLEPETLVATWPLAGYDTRNVVTWAEFKAACVQPN